MALLFPSLFEPYRLGRLEVANRLVRSATYEGLAGPDGLVGDELASLLARLSQGGVGLIVTGLAFVSRAGSISLRQTGIDDDRTIPGLQKVVKAVHDAGEARIVCQLAHAGRQTRAAFSGGTPLAPSAVYEPYLGIMPREMSGGEVEEIIGQFAAAALRAQAAGFDGIQLHAAHGYLISQFLTPKTNLRTDRWGGDTPVARIRFLEEVYRACRSKVGTDFPILVKINGHDFVEGGVDLKQSAVYVRRLGELGVAAIEISGGIFESVWRIFRGGIPFDVLGTDPESTTTFKKTADVLQSQVGHQEAYHLYLAEALKPHAGGAAVMSVGGWSTPLLMDAAVDEGRTDFISLCRSLIRNPDWPRRIKAGAVVPSDCARCNECYARLRHQEPLRCQYGKALRRPPASHRLRSSRSTRACSPGPVSRGVPEPQASGAT